MKLMFVCILVASLLSDYRAVKTQDVSSNYSRQTAPAHQPKRRQKKRPKNKSTNPTPSPSPSPSQSAPSIDNEPVTPRRSYSAPPVSNEESGPPMISALVPTGTNLKVRLQDTLSSKDSRVGDQFTATVLDPVRFNEATITGHISSIQKSGKIEGRTSMNLDFDSIRLSDGRRATLHGYVTRVYGGDSRTVDNEGGIESGSRTNQALKRGGIGAAAGAILGGIAGGGKGAAIGLILGGAGGAGSLAIQGSKELKLDSGTEMLVRVLGGGRRSHRRHRLRCRKTRPPRSIRIDRL